MRIAGFRWLWMTVAITAVCAATAAADPPPKFTDIARSAGIVFRHTFGAEQNENVLMTTGSGCAFFDYDNDGRLDAFLVNGAKLDKHGLMDRRNAATHALFHNERNGTFRNVTETAGITAASYGQGVATADYDADEFVDLYITNFGRNTLYRNRGDGTFEDVTDRAGVGCPRWSAGAVFFDYDGDLDLDLYVSNYLKFLVNRKDVHVSTLSKKYGFRSFPGPRDFEGEEDVLYRNNGDGTFTDVSASAGLSANGKGLTAVALDFDNDGDQDVFVANDATPNFLYRNEGGMFVEIGVEAGVAYDPDGVVTAAMGVDVVDVNGDGLQDLFVTNMVFEFNNLYVNRGDGFFADLTRALGLDEDTYRNVGWAARFADFNHDGHLDCFVANGHVVDDIEGFSQEITYPQQKMMFVGTGRGTFENAADRCGECFVRKRVGRGAAFGDYDNDGDIDILASNSGSWAELLRNETPAGARWLKIRLHGRAPNTQGIGAKVVVRTDTRAIHNEVRTAASYLSASDPTVHVGLRADESAASIDVIWPSGKSSSAPAAAGTLVVMEEPD